MDPKLGNIVISDLFSRFLELVLSDVTKISALAATLAIPMRFCTHTAQLIRFARHLHGCRSALIKADGRELAASLSQSQWSRISLFGSALPFDGAPDAESASEGQWEDRSLQLALDHAEEIEIFQSFAMAKITELKLREVLEEMSRAVKSAEPLLAGRRGEWGGGFRSWLQQCALAEKQLLRILPFHRDISEASRSFVACLDATRQGDLVRFAAAAAPLQRMLHAANLCGEDDCRRIIDYMSRECARDRPDLAERTGFTVAVDEDGAASFTKRLFALLLPIRGTVSATPSLTLTRLRMLKPATTTGQVRAALQTLLGHSVRDNLVSLRYPLWVIALAIIVHLLWVDNDGEVRLPSRGEEAGEDKGGDEEEAVVVTVSHRLRSFLQRLVLVDTRQPDLLVLLEVLSDISRTRAAKTDRGSGSQRTGEQGRVGSLQSMDFSTPRMLEDVISHVGSVLRLEEEEGGQVRLPLSRTLLQALRVEMK